jgi:hypothetical protein
MDYYDHQMKEDGHDVNPKQFESLEDAEYQILNHIFQFASKYNLNFYHILFEGDAPNMESYAFAMHFEEWLEDKEEKVLDEPDSILTEMLASPVDMILPSQWHDCQERIDKIIRICKIHERT